MFDVIKIRSELRSAVAIWLKLELPSFTIITATVIFTLNSSFSNATQSSIDL